MLDGAIELPMPTNSVRTGDALLDKSSRRGTFVPRDNAATQTVPLVEETVEVKKRKRETGTVRVRKQTRIREETVELPSRLEQVEVQRVPINRPVDGPVAMRTEKDGTIVIPILKEEVVTQKRLVLVEEIHIRKTEVHEKKRQRVSVRYEQATVERTRDSKRKAVKPSSR